MDTAVVAAVWATVGSFLGTVVTGGVAIAVAVHQTKRQHSTATWRDRVEAYDGLENAVHRLLEMHQVRWAEQEGQSITEQDLRDVDFRKWVRRQRYTANKRAFRAAAALEAALLELTQFPGLGAGNPYEPSPRRQKHELVLAVDAHFAAYLEAARLDTRTD
ncbi:hypothetical protein [Streptomyces sp. AC550_RSS872]|uniref:hypothetical protein n=1 Tax=Streptomyces sp. AC550_RSS872 TaxID=2823689 RepID=UPI001C27F6FA|nr:hypothetical protein [Streptomyces sp. AC550_RSS872]